MHLERTEESRPAKQIFTYFDNKKNNKWRMSNIQAYLTEMNMSEDDIENRETFRNEISICKGF